MEVESKETPAITIERVGCANSFGTSLDRNGFIYNYKKCLEQGII